MWVFVVKKMMFRMVRSHAGICHSSIFDAEQFSKMERTDFSPRLTGEVARKDWMSDSKRSGDTQTIEEPTVKLRNSILMSMLAAILATGCEPQNTASGEDKFGRRH